MSACSALLSARSLMRLSTAGFLTVLALALPAQAAFASSTTLAITSGGSAVSTVVAGTPVTLTATVSNTPGTVLFCTSAACRDGNLLGQAQVTSAGTATLALPLAAGSYNVFAKFAGTASVAGSTSPTSTLTVTAPTAGYPLGTAILTATGRPGSYSLTGTISGIAGSPAVPIDGGSLSFNDASATNSTLGSAALSASSFSLPLAANFTSGVSAKASVIVSGDFNNDGKLDFVVFAGSNPYSVFLGNGDGTFATALTAAAPGSPNTVNFAATGDFNNDGKLDIALGTSAGTFVLLNAGNGTFTAPSGVVGTNTTAVDSLAIADFNNDGNLDIAYGVYSSATSGNVSILPGTGSGTFGTAVNTGASTIGVTALAAGDLNGDGLPDLVVASGSVATSALAFALNSTAGTFTTTALTIHSGTATTNYSLILADLKGDGIADIIAGYTGATTGLDVYLGSASNTGGTTTPTFAPYVEYPVAGFNAGFNLTLAADEDGDGKLDLVSSSGTTGLQFLHGNQDGTLNAALVSNGPPFGEGLAAANFRGTGSNDIVSATYSTAVSLYFPGQTASATLSNVALPAAAAGTQTITASRPASANYNAVTTNSVTLAGGSVATSTTLTASPAGSSITGTNVTLTATVAPSTFNGTAATGTVTFFNGTASLGTGTVSGGIATLTTTLPAGYLALTASYPGDATFVASSSAALAYNSFATGTVTYTVTSLADTAAGATTCTAGSTTDSACTLRQAITNANTQTSSVIAFGITGTITAGSALPVLSKPLTIAGPGAANITISGLSGTTPTYALMSDSAAAATPLTIYGVTLSGSTRALLIANTAVNTNINNVVFNNNAAATNGSAIYQSAGGTLTINNSTFTNNKQAGTSTSSYGGALSVISGTVNVTNSYFGGNSSASYGGAVWISSNATTPNSFVDDTFYNNSCTTTTGTAAGSGGALYLAQSASIINSTIVGNSILQTSPGTAPAGSGAGLSKTSTGTLTLYNTVIGANTLATGNTNGFADFYSAGSAGKIVANSVFSTGPVSSYTLSNLGLLAPGNYGGPTLTMPLLPGSPLLGAGSSTNPGSPATDQRGVSRPAGINDIGALQDSFGFSFVQQPTTTAAGSTITPAPTAQVTENGFALAASGTPVSLTIKPGTFTAASTLSASTNSSGLATFSSLAPTTASTNAVLTASGTSSGTTFTGQSNPFPVTAGASTQLAFTAAPATPITAGGNAGSVSVAAEDQYGNVIAGSAVSVTLTVTYPNASTQTYTASASNGTATFTLASVALTAAGTYSYTATATGLTAAQASENVNAGPFASIALTGLNSQAAPGIAQNGTVTALDSYGNRVPSFTGTVSLTSSDPIATLPGAYTFTAGDAGAHTFLFALSTAGTDSVTATSGSATIVQPGLVIGDAILIINPNGSFSRLTNAGTATSPAGGYTGGGTPNIGIAIDSTGDVFSLNSASNLLVEFSKLGVALSGSGFTGGGLNTPVADAIDGAGQIWIANSGNSSISVFSNTGTALSPSTGYAAPYSTPTSVKIDISGNVWVVNQGNNTVTEVLGAATPIVPITLGVTNATTGTKP